MCILCRYDQKRYIFPKCRHCYLEILKMGNFVQFFHFFKGNNKKGFTFSRVEHFYVKK